MCVFVRNLDMDQLPETNFDESIISNQCLFNESISPYNRFISTVLIDSARKHEYNSCAWRIVNTLEHMRRHTYMRPILISYTQ